MARWLTERELLEQAGISPAELRWFGDRFDAQMAVLTRRGPDGRPRYAPDAVVLLRSLATMVARGATPEQIKAWYGL